MGQESLRVRMVHLSEVAAALQPFQMAGPILLVGTLPLRSRPGLTEPAPQSTAAAGWKLRSVEPPRRKGKDFEPGLSYRDGMFELGGKRAITGDGGPAVRQDLYVRPAEIDHRLDSEEH